MRTREKGMALLMVLIILAIGAMVVVPLLRLAFTETKLSDINNVKINSLYTLDGAQEYVMWKLLHQDWASDFTDPGQKGYLEILNCGTNVTAIITMRAVPGEGGIDLALEDKIIQPTKTVSPNEVEEDNYIEYTYTISLEQMSNNTTQPLDAIFDILPADLEDYVLGSTEVRIDGGPWLPADDPDTSDIINQTRIHWPKTYDYSTGLGGFSTYEPDPNGFHGIETFTTRQVNELRFKIKGEIKSDGIECNWIVLKPWNTLSGPQAPIAVGSQTPPYICNSEDNIVVTKVADPDFITPGVPTIVTYTLTILNNFGSTRGLETVYDFLPQGFEYAGNVTCDYYVGGNPVPSSINITDPQGLEVPKEINGQLRYELTWGADEFPTWNESFNSYDSIVMTFDVLATKDVSGSYYNEVLVDLKGTGIDQSFQQIGVTADQFLDSYSWNQGTVTVPTYDVETQEEGIIVDSNLSLIVDGISISSYNIR